MDGKGNKSVDLAASPGLPVCAPPPPLVPLCAANSKIPMYIMDDLCSRFIINIPEEERNDLVRLCFQIELAHWFYLDFYCTQQKLNLRIVGIKDFAAHIFKHVPSLHPYVPDLDDILLKWKEYKQSVPTYGAILLDADMKHCLLVQGFWARASWGFPKGKVNKEEEPNECAAREVMEETGFDISTMIDPNQYIEAVLHEQLSRLYIVPGVSMDTVFQPKTRCEIKSVQWFPLADLPANRKDPVPKSKAGGTNSFFMVMPFIKRLRKWIEVREQTPPERFNQQSSRNHRHRHKSVGDASEQQHWTSPNQKKRATDPPARAAKDDLSCRTYKKMVPDAVVRNGTRATRRALFQEGNKPALPFDNFKPRVWLGAKFDRAAFMSFFVDNKVILGKG